MQGSKRLSAVLVKAVSRLGRYGDGRGGYGLSLLVKLTTTGRLSKTFAQRILINGRRVSIGLGSFPAVTLARARDKAFKNARIVEEGGDPRVKDVGVPTFEEALEPVIFIQSANWRGERSEKQWRSSLRKYAMPALGKKPVSIITTSDVLDILTPIWSQKPETARRVRMRTHAVMQWSIAQGYRSDNPAGEVLSSVLPRHKNTQQHMKSLPYSEVGPAIRTINSSRAKPLTKLAIEFLVLTACRSVEVRKASWDEVDFTSAIWTIPAERMKMDREHRVPLSKRAIEILHLAKELANSKWIFPTGSNRPLSDNALSKLFRDHGIPGTPHGMRASFRTWTAEKRVDRDIAEMVLAHEVKGVERAYQRSDLFDLRRQVMEDWAVCVRE